MKWFSHLRTICRHKRMVRRHCFQVGLYRQGLLHDLSKYTPVEFLPGARYYQGTRSPNDIQRQREGVSTAWLHHKGRNKHHLEYWLDYGPGPDHRMTGMRMPVRFVVEMFCDRVAASKNYRGRAYRDSDAWEYYDRAQVTKELLHPESRALLEQLLLLLRDQGEAAAFARAREIIREDRRQRRRKDLSRRPEGKNAAGKA